MPLDFPVPASLKLERFPKSSDPTLRAWSAADELLIQHLSENLKADHQTGHTLILNDAFGALAVSLNKLTPYYWNDSYLARQALQNNLNTNGIAATSVKPFNLVYKTNEVLSQLSDLPRLSCVLIQIPKHNSLLAFQLQQIRPLLAENALVIATGMTKNIHNANIALFEKYIGPTRTSLAKKKARLVFSQPHADTLKKDIQNLNSEASYSLDDEGITLKGLPGVFCREQLDKGSRVLLKHMPLLLAGQKAIDLGCGNGLLGAVLAKRQPQAQVLLVDESAMAVASAELTFASNQLNNGRFVHTDVLQNIEDKDFDHIVCNPPFHQQNVQTLDIAHKMFRQAASKLAKQGELRVVANRHLKYEAFLRRYFSKVTSISADHQFTVWLAQQPKK